MSKKIVYLVEALHKPNNLIRILCQKMNWLVENTDYEVHVVLVERTRRPSCYELSPKVHVVNFEINYDALKKAPPEERWIRYIMKQWKYRQKLRKYLRQISPQVTVTIFQHDFPFICFFMGRSRKLGEIHFDRRTYKQVNIKRLPKWMNWFLTWCRRLFAIFQIMLLDAYVTDTEGVRKEWAKVLRGIRFIPNPLKEYPDTPVGKDVKKIMAIGDFCQGKGFDVLILAWERIARKYPDWRLHLHGDGDQTPYREMIKKRRLSRTIQCYPRPDNLYERYSRYSLLVQTYERDKFGRHIMEAMAYGIPCIAHDVPYGPSELIQDEKNGFLVMPNHLTDFATKLGFLIRDEEFRLEMQNQARLSVLPYRLDEIMPRWVEVFDKLSR